MSKSISELEDDLRTIGKYARGTKRTLLGVIVLLCSLLMWQQAKFSDRFTMTQHQEYVKQHDNNVDVLLERETTRVDESIKDVAIAVQSIREQLAGDRARLKNMERQLDRIEKKVFDGGG